MIAPETIIVVALALAFVMIVLHVVNSAKIKPEKTAFVTINEKRFTPAYRCGNLHWDESYQVSFLLEENETYYVVDKKTYCSLKPGDCVKVYYSYGRITKFLQVVHLDA